ncbi:MAG: anthranilate synthase component 1 [Succinivibrionaceae bacterium]|nr:anthranilate synthase component 1 [Succinivibrionaceae bacterium]
MSNFSLSEESKYNVSDPLALFYDLTLNKKNTILLESLEVHTKAGTTSLLGINSALKFSCLDRVVTIEILNENGLVAAEDLIKLLPANDISVLSKNEKEIKILFKEIDQNQDEDSRLKATTVLDTLRKALMLNPKFGKKEDLILAGVFGYDLIGSFEKLPEVKNGSNTCPDFCFYLLDTFIKINHKEHTSSIHAIAFTEKEAMLLKDKVQLLKKKLDDYKEVEKPKELSIIGEQVRTDISDKDFCEIVKTLKGNILKGDIFQVVPSRTFKIKCPSTINAYHTLKHTNPSPYMFYMNDSDFVIFGASPESSVKFTAKTRQVEMYPIAGTRGRGKNEDGSINLDLDSRIELELRQDKKENAEHLMLVDLARNDIAKISEPGTRHVVDLLNVDRYSHVMHLVSRVVGTLRKDLDALHAYQACMNMGTLTGAPKIKATELIRQTEKTRRGSYGGAIGFLSGNGDMDTCIVIRAAFVKDGIAHVQAGCGVVFDSVPIMEAQETQKKAAAVLNAIALSHQTTLKEIM